MAVPYQVMMRQNQFEYDGTASLSLVTNESYKVSEIDGSRAKNQTYSQYNSPPKSVQECTMEYEV